MKNDLIRGMDYDLIKGAASLVGVDIVVFYYRSTSEIWSDRRDGLW
jgi:hypothetical protein